MSGNDPYRFTTIAHATHTFLGPVSCGSVDALLKRLPTTPEARVLDVGCGKGEMLTRALEHVGGSGLGVEPNPAFAADARARLAHRLAPDIARVFEVRLADSVLGDEPFDVVLCTGSLHAFGDWPTALDGVAQLLKPDGWALLGPGYWKQPPHADYLAAFGGHEQDQLSLLATTAMAKQRGWQLIACHESTVPEWDAYEHAYAANVRKWCSANPDDADAKPFEDRIARWSAAYERWGRDTMGYALMLLRHD